MAGTPGNVVYVAMSERSGKAPHVVWGYDPKRPSSSVTVFDGVRKSMVREAVDGRTIMPFETEVNGHYTPTPDQLMAHL